jgi:hypothetical protein
VGSTGNTSAPEMNEFAAALQALGVPQRLRPSKWCKFIAARQGASEWKAWLRLGQVPGVAAKRWRRAKTSRCGEGRRPRCVGSSRPRHIGANSDPDFFMCCVGEV